MLVKKQKSKTRIGQRAIRAYTKALLDSIETYQRKPMKTARRRYLDAVRSLGALALLFEEVAARKYRVIRLGLKTKKPAIFAERVRKAKE